MDNVNLKLPTLKGKNIEEHFLEMGKQQIKPYKDLLQPLVELKMLPNRPKNWCFQKGWTVYDPESGKSTPVKYPHENGLIFDVEVCMSDGSMPTLDITLESKSTFGCWLFGNES